MALIKKALKETAKELKLKDTAKISVAFIGPQAIRKLNREYRGKDTVTDVLSFVLDEQETKGEILICYAQAQKQAQEKKHSVRDELIFLLVHGVLHVFGFDHETKRQAEKMFSFQEKILTGLGIDPAL